MSFDGIRATDAAVYGYGLLLPKADATIRDAVERMLDEHRARADRARLLWPDAPPAATGYTLSEPLGTSQEAIALAVRFESDCCDGWRSQLESADHDSPEQLGFAMDCLDAAAVQLARWRTLVPAAPFRALPGFPDQE